jgi:hypothetical protein
MNPAFAFRTTCINSTGDAIREMIERSTQISYRTFRRYVSIKEVSEMLGYRRAGERHYRGRLTLNKDWAASYYKGEYLGQPCYFVRWSGIEYIWTKVPA